MRGSMFTAGSALLCAVLLFVLFCSASCSGGNSQFIQAAPASSATPPASIVHAYAAQRGVSLGGFEVIRFNAQGEPDPALNSTLRLSLDPATASGAAQLRIDVQNLQPASAINLEVRYDAQRLQTGEADFAGLLGGADTVLSAQLLGRPGVVALGQAVLRGHNSTGPVSGRFASLCFAQGPARALSSIGAVHHNPNGVGQVRHDLENIFANDGALFAELELTFSAAWQLGDGDQNGEVNIADITPLAQYFGLRPSEDWRALPADYDDNDEVTLSDLSTLGLYYGEGTDSYLLEAADDHDGDPRSLVATLDWSSDAQPPADPGNPAVGQLPAVFRSWGYTFSITSSYSFYELQALDADLNGLVQFYITPQRETAAGTEQGSAASHEVALLAWDPSLAH